MNRFAVFAPGFEHLSYPLGKGNAVDKHSFSDRNERFSLSKAQSEPHAQMALVSATGLSEHTSEPVGYVCAEQGGIFVVCKNSGIVYADCAHEVGGDYKTLGYLNYRTLVLELKPGCPAELAELIQADAAKMQAMRGQFFPISTCGQGVTLGE